VSADAMSELGFGTYSFSSNAPSFQVADGTKLNLVAPYLQLAADYALKPTGTDVAGFSAVQSSPLLRKPVSLVLSQTGRGVDTLRLGAGASVIADPGAAITLNGRGSIDVEGTITAPAGTIAIGIVKVNSSEADFLPNQSVWLGSQASLDVSGVSNP